MLFTTYVGYHLVIMFYFSQVALMQAEIAVKRKECEKDLAKAEPSLTAAVEALNTLNKVPSHPQYFKYSRIFYVVVYISTYK